MIGLCSFVCLSVHNVKIYTIWNKQAYVNSRTQLHIIVYLATKLVCWKKKLSFFFNNCFVYALIHVLNYNSVFFLTLCRLFWRGMIQPRLHPIILRWSNRVSPRKSQPEKRPKWDRFWQVMVPPVYPTARRHRSEAHRSPRWPSGR